MVREGFSDSVVFEQRSERVEGKGNADSGKRALQRESRESAKARRRRVITQRAIR